MLGPRPCAAAPLIASFPLFPELLQEYLVLDLQAPLPGQSLHMVG